MIILKDKNNNSIINIIRGTKYINGSNECNCNLNMLDSSVTRNGVHTFIANDFGADGFSEVRLEVDVPYNSFDFASLGYSSEDIQRINQYINQDINYGKQVQSEYYDYFYYGENDKLVYFPSVDTSNRTSCFQMFSGDVNLLFVPTLTISNKCTSINRMFSYCTKLQYIDVSNWNTENVTDMLGLFSGCNMLSYIKGVENLNTSNVTDMSGLFESCNRLLTLNLSNWNVEKVTSTSSMFENCFNLINLNISSWNTRVKWVDSMFLGCHNLQTLNMSNFDLSNVTSLYAFLEACNRLTNFQAPKNINASISLTESTLLTVDSLLSVLNNLTDRTGTTSLKCSLGTTNLAKLTDEQKAIATNKNWILQ